ncbi:hypothetical protein [Actinoplanes sp. NPDC020271]|uniref:hypothetical protein n=1 Tax=Actinoplanes sp. NPDC020271 TaxID=3363896 RepID=UPI00379B6045
MSVVLSRRRLDSGLAAWLRELAAAVDADNLTPEVSSRDSRTVRLLAAAPAHLAGNAALALTDIASDPGRPLRLLRSDRVCSDFTVMADDASVNLVVARMTVPGGPWPGHFGLEAVAFRAAPARTPDWFPPLAVAHPLCFGVPLAASRGFAEGGGAVLFPEQLSVVNRPSGQAFGVVFLPKLAALFTTHVLPVIDAAGAGFDLSDRAELEEMRAVAFAAHEWGHNAGAPIEQTTVTRRRRFAAVLSELHADLAALEMLLSGRYHSVARPAAWLLVADRVVREAWLPRPYAQVDAIAARHLLQMLATAGALSFGRAGLRIELGPVADAAQSELGHVAEVLAACRSGDLQPAVEYLDSCGWHIKDTDCWLDLGANLGAALTRHSPASAAQQWAA